MPRLPYTSQVDARSGRVNNPELSNAYNAEALGAGVGRGLQALGQGAGRLADAATAEVERQGAEEAANAIAGFDFTPRKLELQKKAPADGSGYRAAMLNEFDTTVGMHSSTLKSAAAASKFKAAMQQERMRLAQEGAVYEAATLQDYNKQQANVGLSTLQNKVFADPGAYGLAVGQMADVIDALPGVTALQKMNMKQEGQYDLARRRFEGLVQNASTLDAATSIGLELSSKEWADKLKPEDMFRLQERVDSTKRGIASQLKSVAEGKISSLRSMSDSTTLIPTEDIQDMQTSARLSGDPKIMAESMRIARSEAIKAETVKLPVAAQRMKLEAAKNRTLSSDAGLPKRLSDAINQVSAASGVSPSFMAVLAKKEYGSKFKGDATDYGQPTDVKGADGKPSTSAVGVGQFIESTFLGLMRDPNVAASMGVNTSGMTDAEILDLRKNPEVSMAAVAALASKNQKVLENKLGRPVDDAELYMAHFLGAEGAVALISAYMQMPDTTAASVLPEAAKSNPGAFYRDGVGLTAAQVYENISRSFTSVPGRVAFDDARTYEMVLQKTEKALAEDPMTHAQTVGDVELPQPGSDNYFAAMAGIAQQVAAKHSIPMASMKPLRQADADALSAQLADGTADEAANMLASIATMGPMAMPAIKQLGEKDPVFGYAGQVYLNLDQGAGAQIIRGQKMLQENKALLEQNGFKPADVATEFSSAVGGALNGLDPKTRQQIYDASLAYAVASATRGVAGPVYKSGVIKDAVEKVTAGIGPVNGVPVILERGVTADDLDMVVSNATVGEWAALSQSGTPPRFSDGSLASSEQINDEVVLQAIGGGKYMVMTGDGLPLMDGAAAVENRREPFIISVDDVKITKMKEAILARGDIRPTIENGFRFWRDKMRDK